LDKIDAGPASHVPEAPFEDGASAASFDVWRAARAGVGEMFRLPRLGTRGVAAALGVVILAWASTALYRVQPDE
jgi:modulator of FtsH protease HflK